MSLSQSELRIPQPRTDAGADQWYGPNFEVQAAAAVAATTANFQRQPEPAWSGIDRRRPAPPAKRGTSPLLLIVCFGLLLSLVLNVELVMMRGSRSAGAVPPAVDIGASAAQVDLFDIARAETTYRVSSSTYTTDTSALAAAGYQPVADTAVTVYVGINNAESFCAAAGGAANAVSAVGSTWFLYDSSRGGLVNHAYATEQAAQLACGDAATTGFQTIA